MYAILFGIHLFEERFSRYPMCALASFRAATNAATQASISSFVVRQEQTLMRMTGSAFQTAPPHQQTPFACKRASVDLVSSAESQPTST